MLTDIVMRFLNTFFYSENSNFSVGTDSTWIFGELFGDVYVAISTNPLQHCFIVFPKATCEL
jgi:hypothetical protein